MFGYRSFDCQYHSRSLFVLGAHQLIQFLSKHETLSFEQLSISVLSSSRLRLLTKNFSTFSFDEKNDTQYQKSFSLITGL